MRRFRPARSAGTHRGDEAGGWLRATVTDGLTTPFGTGARRTGQHPRGRGPGNGQGLQAETPSILAMASSAPNGCR